jgi:murein DD-endopeptidase MepM/ murein hydrolase activator NlpD
VLAAAIALAPLAGGAAPPFVWPLDCIHGEDCWIVRHVDRDPGPGVRDVGCGRLGGDGHRGTDIALADMSALARGVAVRAPAAGTVVGARDGMPDVASDAATAPALDGRNCGNGVRLDHGDGWISQLCHLRRGSVAVRPGDRVAAGALLGRVGLSGETSFPHLHVGFERAGRLIDVMDGAVVGGGADCGGVDPLFANAPAYLALPLVGAGVAPTVPDDADLLRGWHRERRLPPIAPALVVWMQGYGTRAGDVLRFRLRGPDGTPVIDHRTSLERGHARGSYYAGARRPEGGWPSGRYAGTVTWRRDDVTVRRGVTLEVTAPSVRR